MTEADACPWDSRYHLRRDADPHRGQFLKLLGTVSVLCGLVSVFLVIPSLLGLPVGLFAVLAARRDLGKMRAGLMDPRGSSVTADAANMAFCGVVANTVAPPFLPAVLLLFWLSLP
jgi:hypothetical protein